MHLRTVAPDLYVFYPLNTQTEQINKFFLSSEVFCMLHNCKYLLEQDQCGSYDMIKAFQESVRFVLKVTPMIHKWIPFSL